MKKHCKNIWFFFHQSVSFNEGVRLLGVSMCLFWFIPIYRPTCKNSLLLSLFFSFLLFVLFLSILACRCSTLCSAVVEKNLSHTTSLTWDSLPAMTAIMSSINKMAINGAIEFKSSSLGLGRHFFSNKVIE